MDIQEKQARWALEKPLFEAEFIHSHLLPFFNFNENTGDYEIKSECVKNTDDEDQKVAYETLNTGWVMWLRAKQAKAKAVPEGFVLVPHDVADRCIGHISLAMCHQNNSNAENDVMQLDLDILGSVIDAQEPAQT